MSKQMKVSAGFFVATQIMSVSIMMPGCMFAPNPPADLCADVDCGDQICDPDTGNCVECVGDAQCDDQDPTTTDTCEMGTCINTPEATPAQTFPTSIHATRQGKEYFYSEDNGGFEAISGVAMSSLGCQNCHASSLADGTPVTDAAYQPTCADCHADVGDPGAVEDSVCLGCHSRQNVEIGSYTDYHRDVLGFTCMSCHNTGEMHGDGTEYESMLSDGAITTQCEDCHDPLPDNSAHTQHSATVDCAACHLQSVISCYNCHFESELAGAGKRFLTPPRKDFKFLVRKDGKVTTATFQSLVYEGKSFYVIAPYYAHTVASEAPSCNDCHGSAAAQEYSDTGKITVTQWDAETGTLAGPSGVIPIPPDWRTALQFDFVDYTGDPTTPIAETDPTLWQYLKTGADMSQMLFAEPLTAEQMQALE